MFRQSSGDQASTVQRPSLPRVGRIRGSNGLRNVGQVLAVGEQADRTEHALDQQPGVYGSLPGRKSNPPDSLVFPHTYQANAMSGRQRHILIGSVLELSYVMVRLELPVGRRSGVA